MRRNEAPRTAGALIFDPYGTLLDTSPVAEACDGCFPGRGGELARLWRGKQLEYCWLLSLMGRYIDYWQVTERALVFSCRSMGLPLADSARKGLLEAHLGLGLHPDAGPALEALSGYRMALLSNASVWMLGEAVGRNGIDRYFARIVSADEVGAYKPDPRPYNLAVTRMDVRPGEALYVCASPWDLCGAIAAGLPSCWLRRGDAEWDELGYSPDLTVSGLAELVAVLARRKGESDDHRAA